MSWRMMDFSEKTLNCLRKFRRGDDPAASAYFLLKELLNPYGDDPYLTYRYEHSLRVAGWGLEIAAGERWEAQPLMLACLLHDAGYPECRTEEDFNHHQDVSARIAEMLLDAIGYDEEKSKLICRAVQLHNLWDDVPSDATPFELSVRDADDLDRFDALRTYMKGGDIVGNTFICDRSSVQIMDECEKNLRKIEKDSGHVCATQTARKLWKEQLDERKIYFTRLFRQMSRTSEVELHLLRIAGRE